MRERRAPEGGQSAIRQHATPAEVAQTRTLGTFRGCCVFLTLSGVHDLLHGFFSMLRNSGLRSGRPSERAWLAARRFAAGTCELLAYSGGPGPGSDPFAVNCRGSREIPRPRSGSTGVSQT